MVLWCAMYLVRGCALVGSLAIQTYSLSRLSFAIKIISVNGSESVGPVVQKCRSTWQDLFNRYACVCVCVCAFSSHPFWTSSLLDVPAGVTQEEGHTGFLIHLPSAVRALIFVARRIQPFLSLVDREVEFCVLTN